MTEHLVIDLETLGTHSNAPVISVGAVIFDINTGESKNEFYKVIELKSALERCKVDSSTLQFWFNQPEEAREIFTTKRTTIQKKVFEELNIWITGHLNVPLRDVDIQFWGNGATFDNVILKNAYARCGVEYPFKFWNDRDMRTLVELSKSVSHETYKNIVKNAGDPKIKHHALHDARHEAALISAMILNLKNEW